MALSLGTNCGFVTTAPTSDPAGTDWQIDTYCDVTKDTSPGGATKITEVGWYCDNASQEANFEIGLYTDYLGAANILIYSAKTNAKGTGAGWKRVTVDWPIDESTIYWLGLQCDDTATTTNTNYSGTGGSGLDSKSGSTLPDPYNGGAVLAGAGMEAIYALVEVVAPTHIHINVGDVWKDVTDVQINIGDTWKTVTKAEINIGDVWKTIFG